MPRKILKNASAILQLALVWSAGPAQSVPPSFSADVVSLDSGGARLATAARLYVASHKTRIETDGGSAGFFLSDADAGTALFVRSALRVYMDARRSTPLTQIFVSVDPHDPCRGWQAAAATAGMPGSRDWHCEFIERASVNKREIIEYRVVTSDRLASYGWVDSTLDFPVKWQAADGKVFAVENILLQTQPASLFNIPPEYRKLDPQALLERIKHSDIWAEPTK